MIYADIPLKIQADKLDFVVAFIKDLAKKENIKTQKIDTSDEIVSERMRLLDEIFDDAIEAKYVSVGDELKELRAKKYAKQIFSGRQYPHRSTGKF